MMLTCHNITCGSIPGSPPHYFSLLHRGAWNEIKEEHGNEIKEEHGNETQGEPGNETQGEPGNETQEEFAQSQDCTAHSQNPETACQSQDWLP